MERAKAFLYVCAGIFLVLAGISIRSTTSLAQASNTLDIAGWYAGYAGGVVNRVLVREGGTTRIITPPIPGTSPVVGLRPDDMVVILANGEVWGYSDQWRFSHNMLDGVLGVTDTGAGGNFGLRVSPNPSLGQLDVQYSLSESAQVELEVLDVQGRLFGEVHRGVYPAGRHSLSLGALGSGSRLSPGTYFVRIQSGTRKDLSKAVVVR